MPKKGKMTEQEKLAWWAANKAKAALKEKTRKERIERLNREGNDPNSESNKLLRKWHPNV